MKRLTDLQRLLAKVEITPTCWIWAAAITPQGYGRFAMKAADGRWLAQLAHRVSYELHVGAIPAGLQIDHLCRVRLCVNPTHLEPVTQRENILRSDAPSALVVRTNRCGRGHELSAENTHVTSAGFRQCRACARIRWAAKEHTPEQRERARERARAAHVRKKASA